MCLLVGTQGKRNWSRNLGGRGCIGCSEWGLNGSTSMRSQNNQVCIRIPDLFVAVLASSARCSETEAAAISIGWQCERGAFEEKVKRALTRSTSSTTTTASYHRLCKRIPAASSARRE